VPEPRGRPPGATSRPATGASGASEDLRSWVVSLLHRGGRPSLRLVPPCKVARLPMDWRFHRSEEDPRCPYRNRNPDQEVDSRASGDAPGQPRQRDRDDQENAPVDERGETKGPKRAPR
jgi:hypothetical protein